MVKTNKLQLTSSLTASLLMVTMISCMLTPTGEKQTSGAIAAEEIYCHKKDSLALLELTKKLVQWVEEAQTGSDFVPLPAKKDGEAYEELDIEKHQKRLQELEKTQLFSRDFIDNYNKIALQIHNGMKNGSLVWNAGGNAAFWNWRKPLVQLSGQTG